MSAIWGAVSLEGKTIDNNIKEVFLKAYENCVIDRFSEYSTDKVYMGCGIQYFTTEAQFEKLPIKGEQGIFTADVVLDNREELIATYQIDASQTTPDGEILLQLLEKGGMNAVADVLGAFAYSYYNEKEKSVTLTIDSVGDRVVYYTVYDNMVFFSSLLEPLVTLTEAKLNDRWITDFLAMDHLYMINETEETPYYNIFRVAPAHSVKFTNAGIEKKRYWSPVQDNKEIILNSDEEYKKEFQKVFFEAVKSCIRGVGTKSVLLSGGYDSTAAAAITSKVLGENEKILSFTSVPLKDFSVDSQNKLVDDESEDVRKTVEYLGNIEPYFVDMVGMDAWNRHEEEVGIVEMPYKSVQNLIWIPECMRQAYAKGARIMLTGSMGNSTISYTNIEVYCNELFQKGQKAKLERELDIYSQKCGFDKEYALQEIKKAKNTEQCIKKDWNSLYGKSYVRMNMIQETGADARMISMQQKHMESAYSYEHARKTRVQDIALRQIGEIATKHSLATGVLLRDPTKDRRVIEFCLRIPLEQFCKDGEDRRLVSIYLKEFMPPHILDTGKKGRQSADLIHRLSKNWKQVREEWMLRYQQGLDSRYVDSELALRELQKKVEIAEYTQKDLVRHIYTIMVLELEAKNQNSKKDSADIPDNPLLSVIVPVHNGEKYLEKAVDAICRQTYQNMEILLVDDGSTDNSLTLCKQLREKDERIQVLHQQKQEGLAAANKALEIAKGDIIGFMEIHNFIKEDMYETMIAQMLKYHADVVACDFKQAGSGEKEKNFVFNGVCVLHGVENMTAFVSGWQKRCITPSVWNKIYTRQLLQEVRFEDVSNYEEQLFNIRAFGKVKKGVFMEHSCYCETKERTEAKKQIGSAEDVKNYLYIQSVTEDIVTNAMPIREEYYQQKLVDHYILLLDWYCEKRKHNWNRTAQKILLEELQKLQKQVTIGIQNKKGISKRHKKLLLLSCDSILLYQFLKEALRYARKLKK